MNSSSAKTPLAELQLLKSTTKVISIALEPMLAADSVKEALVGIGQACLLVFAGQRVLLHFQKEASREHEREEVFTVVDHKTVYPASTTDAIFERWQESGLDKVIRQDIDTRMSAISYSNFSWPFPQFHFEDESGIALQVP